MCLDEAETVLKQHTAEREHWCLVGDKRYPAKQAYQLLTGLPRSQFTSHQALSELKSLGFSTSTYLRRSIPLPDPDQMLPTTKPDLKASAFKTLSMFLAEHELTDQIANAEKSFVGADRARSEEVTHDYQLSDDLLAAALELRKHVGRLSDVIHATTIARSLPLLLEPGERISVRPSLGASC